mgnify:CR=1 FL=1
MFNIGNKNQDRVLVSVYNKELGVDQSFVINKLNKESKEKKTSFSFAIPRNAQDKTYNIELNADYDYDKVNDEYKHSLDTTEKVPLKVFGCVPSLNVAAGVKAQISAAITSEVVAGKDVVIKATIQNAGNTTTTYALGVKGIDSWATLSDVSVGGTSTRTLSLTPGQSKDVTFTLATKDTITGEQSLVIEAISDRSDSKTFSVTFPQAKSGFSGLNFGNNTLLWVVGIMNVVLLILIILVAVRISRR